MRRKKKMNIAELIYKLTHELTDLKLENQALKNEIEDLKKRLEAKDEK